MTGRELNDENLISLLSLQLRLNGMTFDGDVEMVEDRAFNILWRNPSRRGGFSYAEIKPHLSAAIAKARELGPIRLQEEVAV